MSRARPSTASLLATISAAGLLGCVEAPGESSTAGVSFEELKATAKREAGTGAYIVDWDIALHGDDELYDYWKQYQQGGLSIYSVGGADIKWDATRKKNLTYCIGATFGANKAAITAAMRAATANGWEKFADIRFVHVAAQDANCTASNNNVLFDVNQNTFGDGTLARAFFPDDARANRNVLVDPTAFDPAQTGNITLTNIIIHELGHVLGFRHEHIRAPGNPCPEDQNFRGVTQYDQVSTMHYPQCGSPNNTLALSTLDQSGAAQVYGPPSQNASPMTNITAPMTGALVGQSFQVDAAVVDTDLVRAELRIDGAVYQTLQAAPFKFQVRDLAEGAHTLEVAGVDGSGQESTAVIDVTVSKSVKSDDGAGTEGDLVGGCSTGGGAGLLLGLALVGLVARRRRA